MYYIYIYLYKICNKQILNKYKIYFTLNKIKQWTLKRDIYEISKVTEIVAKYLNICIMYIVI